MAVKTGVQMSEAGSIRALAGRPSSIIVARFWKGRGDRTEIGAISKGSLDRIGLLSPRVNLQEGDRRDRGERDNREQRIRSGRVIRSETGRRNHCE